MIIAQIPVQLISRCQQMKTTKKNESTSSGTHSFRRCSKSPMEEGIEPLILLLEISLRILYISTGM